MIVLKISNASELMASKLGKFLESLTPESLDQTTIEDVVLKKLVQSFVVICDGIFSVKRIPDGYYSVC